MSELISVLCPTRKRPNNMQSLVSSAMKTAESINNIEFVFYIDRDDGMSQKKIEELYREQTAAAVSGKDFPKIKHVVGERIILSQMWNECLKVSSGSIFMHCGDDILFRSDNWDSLVIDAFDEYDDKIVLVYGNDGLQNEGLSTHGFVHRKWVDAVGYICPPYFSCDWNDRWLFDVAKHLRRTKWIPEVFTEHLHPDSGKSELDETHRERIDRGKRDNVSSLYHGAEMHIKRTEDIQKLHEEIKRCKTE
jgi:hypothetical protein